MRTRMQKQALTLTVLAGLFLVLCSVESFASSREDHRLGVYGDFLGEPFPSLWGVNLAYNVLDFLRVSGGYGQVPQIAHDAGSISASTFGLGLRFLFPGANLSPFVGVQWALLSSQVNGTISTPLYGIHETSTQSVISGSLGVEWQTEKGFFLAVGYVYALSLTGAYGPFLDLGWFFF